jgi:formiminotetrahydrofolate cyclodeaminase
MAGALLAMICRLPVEGHEIAGITLEEAGARCQRLGEELQAGSAADREAYESVRAAFRLPRSSDAERAVRSRAVQAAWVRAAEVPLANANLCWQVLMLAQQLEGRTNPNALSDYRCARLFAQAGLQGCLENVAINIPMIKDGEIAGRFTAQVNELREKLKFTVKNENEV